MSKANPNIRYLFSSWSDGVTTPARTISVPATNTTYQANYLTQVLVTTNTHPSNAGTLYGGGWYLLQPCQKLKLDAVPAQNYYFTGFIGSVTSTTNPLYISCLAQPMSVTANFAADPQTFITATPPNAVILVDNVPYAMPHIFTWSPGSTHVVDAGNPKPPAAVRFSFNGWSDGGSAVHTITAATSNTMLAANFRSSYSVAVSTTGSGTVNITPPSPTGDGFYPASTKLTFTAVPAAGYAFAGFGGDLSGQINPQSISIEKAMNITAQFVNSNKMTN